MSTILSVEKLEQLQTAVDKIVEARHANENVFSSQAASEEIIKTMGIPVQDPQKSYELYYHNIQKALRMILPTGKPQSKVVRELVAILLSHKEKNNIKEGVRGADSRMATTEDMSNLIDVLSEWSENPDDIMSLMHILLNKNQELGYCPQDRQLKDYL